MAITKLMHMKEAPGFKAQHLCNSIRYVLDVKHGGAKTDFGKWVGGNSGLEHDEILQSFLDTKKSFGKEDGRQGYHFVISFSPGEVDAQTCFNVLDDFCQEYLGDAYEYMYAVHTDQDHMHGHIIFNSISRDTGYKYRYEKGDWEKKIQPITDKICKNYNLAPLTMEKDKVGVSYAAWSAEKKGKINWTHIMRADIDYAIENSSDIEEFFINMDQMNYKLDLRGYSKKYGSQYITFHFTDLDGKDHRRRSYNLTQGKNDLYSLESIKERIVKKPLPEPYNEYLSEVLTNRVNVSLGQMTTTIKGTKTYKRMYQAVSYYRLPNPYAVPAREVRKDMLRIEKLIEDCMYLKNNPSMNYAAMEKRLQNVDEKLKELYIQRKLLKEMESNVQEEISGALISRYHMLKKIMSESREFDDRWEKAEDELEDIIIQLPSAFIENDNKLNSCNRTIENLKKEKRILGRVLETEGGSLKSLNKELEITPGKL